MPRKRPPVNVSAVRQPGGAVSDGESGQPLPTLPLALFGLLVLVELAMYYRNAPLQHLQRRTASLVFLTAPDELFFMWCGGQVANFSLLDRWPIALLAGVVLGGAWLSGRLVLSGLGVRPLLDRLERQVFALGVGLNLLSLYALAVGLAGGLQQWWLFLAPLLLLAVANITLCFLAGTIPVPGSSQGARDALNHRGWYWWLLAALPFALVLLLGAMLPPWDYDVREYHLQTPKEWYQNGRIEFLPHNIYANMPLGSELTALWAMALAGGTDGWWWGAMAGKTVMACYSLISAAALIAFGRRLHSLAVGVLAAVIFLSTPWIAALAVAGYNEGPVALYALLAIYALWLASRQQQRLPAQRLVALAGFCAGSAVACKYPPLLFVVVPLLLWVAGHWCFGFVWSLVIRHSSFAAQERLDFKTSLLNATLFLLAALAACGPWFAKNWALTNNPTYPLLYSAFDGRTRTPAKHAQWQKVHSPQPDSAGRRFSLRSFAEQLAWNGWRTLWASLTIPPLVGVAWLARSQRPLIAALFLWMAFVFVAWWLFTHRLDRFLVLLLPLAALVAALGVFAVPHPAWRIATLSLVAVSAAVQFPFVALHPDNRYFAPLERLRRDDRDLGDAGVRIEAAHRWLNANARPGEKVLLVGDAEPFDLELPAIYNTCFDDCQFTRLFQGITREERLSALRNEKIAYVFFSWAHLARYRSPGNYGYTSDYPTPQLVHDELVNEQQLLIPIPLETESPGGELFRVAPH